MKHSNGSTYILSFDVKEQLMMVIQNSCRVNREHAHIYSGVLWTWTWPDAMVSTPCALWLKSEAWSYYLFEIWTKKAQNLKNRTHCLVFGCPVFRGLLYTTAIGSIDIRSLVTIFLTKTAWNNFVTGLNQSRLFSVQALIVSKVVLDTFEPVAIFYEIDKTITSMFERQKMFRGASSTSTVASESGPSPSRDILQYCNYLPRIDFLQVLTFFCCCWLAA